VLGTNDGKAHTYKDVHGEEEFLIEV